MGRIDSSIEAVLRDNSNQIWFNACRSAATEMLSREMATRIDLQNCDVSSDWHEFDDPHFLKRLFVTLPGHSDNIVKHLLNPENFSKGSALSVKKFINNAIRANGDSSQANSQLKSRLAKIAPSIIAERITDPVFADFMNDKLWQSIGDVLAATGFELIQNETPEEEWLFMNRAIIARWLKGCRFITAERVQNAIRFLRDTDLQIRGYLYGLPDKIGAAGITDPAPHLSTFSLATSLQVKTQMATLIESESGETVKGNGFIYRLLGLKIRKIGGSRELTQLYEYTVLSYMTVSHIEQLLRSSAEGSGIVTHLKTNGEPKGVLRWFKRIGLPSEVEAKIRYIFDSKGANLRNRMMHGALLDHRAKFSETWAAMNNKFPVHIWRDDPQLPHNIFRLCLECLSELDQEVGAASKSSRLKNTWTRSLVLAPDELDFASSIPCDLHRLTSSEASASGLEWMHFQRNYLSAIVPGMLDFWGFGAYGWLDGKSLPLFYSFSLIFEAIYRTTVHVLGFKIVEYGATNNGTVNIKTFMLDGSERGICTNHILDSIVAQSTRPGPNAKRVLRLAIKLRNGLAHGAYVSFDEDILSAMGNVFFKAIQMLCSAGYCRMVHEAAFYRHTQNEKNGQESCHLENWNQAQHFVSRQIQSYRGKVR